MRFDLEFGCRQLIKYIVSSRTAAELEENGFQNIPEEKLMSYINSLIDLGWVREENGLEGDDFVVYAFTEKGRKIFENPVSLLSLTDTERDHVNLLKKLDAAKREDDIVTMPPLLLSLANACLGTGRYDSALVYAMELQNVATRIRSPYFKAESMIMQAKIDTARGDIESALKNYREGIKIFRELGETGREGDALRMAGGLLLKLGKLTEAKKCFEESLEKLSAVNNMSGALKARYNIALVSAIMGDFETAQEYWDYVRSVFESMHDYEAIGVFYNNLAGIYILRGDYERSSLNSARAAEAFRKARNRYFEVAALINLAFCQAKLGNFENTEKLLEEMTPAIKEGFDAYSLAWFELISGIYCTYRGSMSEAQKHFESAIRFANSSGNKELIATCHHEYGIALLERDRKSDAQQQLMMSEQVLAQIKGNKMAGV